MHGLAFFPQASLLLICSSFVLQISSDDTNGNIDVEKNFIKSYENSETAVTWVIANSSTSAQKKQICESLRTYAGYTNNDRIQHAIEDQGFLLFRNKEYLSRSIDTIKCQVDRPDRPEYFHCTRGGYGGGCHLLREEGDHMFYLSKFVDVPIPEHRPGEILLRNREERLRELAGSGVRPTRRKRIEQPIDQKPNYENLRDTFHHTIWEADL